MGALTSEVMPRGISMSPRPALEAIHQIFQGVDMEDIFAPYVGGSSRASTTETPPVAHQGLLTD